MSDSRPTVDPALLSSTIDGAPARIRRRLDRNPNAAEDWKWTRGENEITIQAGNETVQLPTDHIDSLDQLKCSCLLAPNCFHIIACLTSLQVAAPQESAAQEQLSNEPVAEADNLETSVLDARQQSAAADLAASITRLVEVGIAGAGVSVQSGLMRAVHGCRASGLYRAASAGLRVLEGTRQVRQREAEADPSQLAEDITDCAVTAHHLQSATPISDFWIGTARRKYYPVRPKRLNGLLAEPILTLSGYAGVAVYFVGDDDAIYTVADVRPGGAELCRGAYRGGIDIGPIVQPAIKLARGRYLVSEMTASRDGRLGRGKSVKIAGQGASQWSCPTIQKRFQVPLADQWDQVYAQTSIPADVRPAGWDFVFVTGAVIGALGSNLLLRNDTDRIIALAIANDTDELYFRENLRMLSHAPELKLRVVGRLDLEHPTTIQALAVVGDQLGEERSPEADATPEFDLPEQLAGRIFLGLDEIPRHCLRRAQSRPVVIADHEHAPEIDLLAPLRRRWVAMMLGGTSSQQRTVTNTIADEIGQLHRTGLVTGASLLDAIARGDQDGIETFLGTGIYLRRCTAALARSAASFA